MDVDIVRTDQAYFEAKHDDIEQHIEKGDKEQLMRSFTQIIDQSTSPEHVIGQDGIHAPTTKAPRHWYRRKLTGWIHSHLVPEGFKKAVEKKYGNFVVIRSTGEYHYEEMPIYTRIGMHLLFGGYYRGKVVSSNLMHELFLKESLRQGIYFNKPESVRQIPSFIEHYSIDMEEYVISNVDEYHTFNEFFTRAILPDKRPIADPEDENRIVSSADCRLNVFNSVTTATQLWVKGRDFNLINLLQNHELAQELDGGSLAIFRLAPQDYHRFHIPTSGTIVSIESIQGTYYTVNPCVVNEDLDVFTDNHRCIVTVQSPLGFKYAVVCIGALLVGSIVFTNAEEGKTLEKGQEMGYFQYGGSTVITVFPKDLVEWDEDLLSNSNKSVETLVSMGEGMGRFV
ncbi:hypothetical protein G6F57_002845 [Rhizopus arrhizus]|uniref:phosphatidylserine decarboxylase n=1 Tax=Rhizopus oryzae TaxID=64495 RepID=A0A9P7BVU8_RHIOR|nr:hypothetical protein G6F23_009733 [Rhizopus arrhizus]KAG1416015.1 hypothetical protein G6F58_006187 [Rhizopus delemar]KAG0767841.1 hypothetical protein G6F24_002442 [Rhizopus arrhizus]KAG0792363.1 hypothetical protein G6F21_004416 [Rhizopus arrhizus]KAG0815777.1 hypothetical protein G6F20_003727 [Rhizopus arrhizus]